MEETEKSKRFNKIAFDFYDCDRDGQLSVLDLIKIQTFFEESSEIGLEIAKLMEVYKSKNVMPKYVRHPLILNFDMFC